MKPFVTLVALLSATVACAEFPEPGEWPSYRRDAALDGRAPVQGAITKPEIAWRKFIGFSDTDFVLTPGNASQPSDANAPCWGLQGPLGEVGGKPEPVTSSVTTAYADVFPEIPGLEKLEFESGFNFPTVNGQWQPVVGRCFAWKDGTWTAMWTTDPIPLLFQPLPIVGDFDRDGRLEVAILPFDELLLFDAKTGKIKDRCAFTKGRSYGAFHVEDLDGDGLSEFIVLADFVKHLNVLGYRDHKLTLLWRREIELTLENPQKMLRAHPHPIADLNGDGRKELVANLFNDSGDSQWHLMIFDGMTGDVLADSPREFMQGMADIEGNERTQLLTADTHGNCLPEQGVIRIRAFDSGHLKTRWSKSGTAWQTWNVPVYGDMNTTATHGREDVLTRRVGDETLAVVRTQGKGSDTLLKLLHGSRKGYAWGAEVSGPRLTGRALAPDGALLFRATTQDGATAEPVGKRAAIAKLATTPRGFDTYGVPAVFRERGNRPAIAVQTPADELVLLQASPTNTGAEEVRRLAGRGQGPDWPTCLGPVVSDLAGDGRRQLLYATAAPEGHARLVATEAMGKELWHHDFPTLPGGPPVWNTGGIVLWQTAHFTDRARRDVLVTIRRTIMHTEETYLLSGRDGSELWRRNSEVGGRGVGGQPFAIADFDGDGLDDAASFHPSLFYILKGTTGKDIIAKEASWEAVPAKPVYWGMAVAGDFDGTGTPSLFFGTLRRSMTGLVHADGALAWWDALDKSGTGYPAFGRFDASGRLQAVIPGYDDGFRCYDTATGKLLWHMKPPTADTFNGSASADIDSCGRDEVLYTAGNMLYCLSSETGDTAAIKWQCAMPAWVGAPVVADADGSGKASILMIGLDGYLYCVR